MGLLDGLGKFWNEVQQAANAPSDLETALKNSDIEAARAAILHAHPHKHIYEDTIIRTVGVFSKTSDDPDFLREVRNFIYKDFDSKSKSYTIFPDEEAENRKKLLSEATGYKHPLRVYGMAAYMNDVEKLQELGEKGIKPDEVSNSRGLTENVISGTARLGMYEAMKEVIHQGASIDRNYGYDDFSPLHAFSKPLFHIYHPGVTEALKETGHPEILKAIEKAEALMGAAEKPPNPDRFDHP